MNLVRLLFFSLCIIIVLWILFNLWRQSLLRNMLFCLVNQFQKSNVDYWVDFGTLLGLERQQDVIFADPDADVCILTTQENIQRVEQVLMNLPAPYCARRMQTWNAYRMFYDKMGEMFHVDIYMVIQHNSEVNTGENTDDTGININNVHIAFIKNIPSGTLQFATDDHTPESFIFPIQTKTYNVNGQSLTCRIPGQPKRLLEYRYGKNYMIPSAQWWHLWLRPIWIGIIIDIIFFFIIIPNYFNIQIKQDLLSA